MRILIVDDEAGVLQAIMAIVKAVPGHEVKVAANAQKAVEHAAAMGGVDLLITDVVMEPTDGFALRTELQSHYPAMQTVFISGYDLSDYAEQLAGAPVLSKPVDAMAIISGIGTAAAHLAAPPPAAAPEKARVAGKTTAITVPAVAVAQPVAVPQPVAQAVPAAVPAQPVAVPRAAAVPVAAQPVARAVPQPAAVPAAQPVAVRAVPQGVPAVPAAQPTVQLAPQPVAVPAAQPVARAVPQVPSAIQSAPRAVPQAAVAAAPRPVSAVAAPQPAAVPPDGSQDPLIGVQLGDYRVQQLIGRGKWGSVYLALQLSVNRRVGLKVLDPAVGEDEATRAHFMNDARAKAAVQHPSIMSVFEADERNGLAFFTHEFLEGSSMEERIATGQALDEKTALHVLKVAGDALQYLWSRNLSHSAVDANSIRLGPDNIARMANLAIADLDPGVTVQREIQSIGAIIQQLTLPDKISGGLRALLGRMTGGPNPVVSWPVVLQAVKALEPKVVPVEAAKMKAADEAAQRAIEAARKARKRSMVINICTLGALLIVLGFVVWKFVISNARKLDEQVQIPAGSYPVGEPGAGKADLGAFEIDRYEVTIGEYAKFIAWCEKNQDREHEFDHNRGDRKTPHVNQDVVTLIRNAQMRNKRVFRQDANPARKLAEDPGVEVDLNCPMVGVTFWDAYAYAQWRGKIVEGGAPRDLPTEEEWEAAARGTRGFKYPWGDEMKPKNFNSNQGYNPMAPGGTKTDDGYNYWAPVDAFSGDSSEFKVVGMAGNVLEWVYRKEGSKEIPLLKGGSFATPLAAMWDRILKIPAEDCWFVHPAAEKRIVRPGVDGEAYFVGDDVTPVVRSLYIGFRTIKRK